MKQNIHLSLGSNIRRNKNKIEEEPNLKVVNAHFLGGHKIFLTFSNGVQRVINFEPVFSKYVKGYYSKYFLAGNFKKFIINNGNIYWGKNEDVIFPVLFLLKSKQGVTQKEEVLYVI